MAVDVGAPDRRVAAVGQRNEKGPADIIGQARPLNELQLL
jgi:hypothetical protein